MKFEEAHSQTIMNYNFCIIRWKLINELLYLNIKISRLNSRIALKNDTNLFRSANCCQEQISLEQLKSFVIKYRQGFWFLLPTLHLPTIVLAYIFLKRSISLIELKLWNVETRSFRFTTFNLAEMFCWLD